MKAAQLKEYGRQLEVVEVEKPSPGEGQVLVEVHAAAVNPFDVKVQGGVYKEFISIDLPATLGGDVAGVVSEVAEGVSGFKVGQPVFGQANAVSGHGSFAEFTPVNAGQLIAKPDSLDNITAAALPLVGVSAYEALVEHMSLQPDQKILIHGAAGGIGSVAVQIAKSIGARVAATASAEDIDYVKDLGADEVIDYKAQDFVELVKDYDAVFDTVGGETNAASYEVLKGGGVLVSMVQPVDEVKAAAKNIVYVQQNSRATTERLAAIAKLVEEGKLKINVDKVFPFEEAASALEYLKTAHVRGKVVIQVKQ